MSALPTSAIRRLSLVDFRSYASVTLETGARCCALIGENGAGKTNLLEAISLFTPGRGLRRNDLASMARLDGPGTFAISLTLDPGEADEGVRLGVGISPADEEGRRTRQNRLAGADAGSATAFSEYLRIVWLTPDMDGLFRGAAGDRRRFLDRLVLAVDAGHAARSTALERALRQRNRLLEEGPGEASWLDAAEREIAQWGVEVAVARAHMIERLNAIIQEKREREQPFPSAGLRLAGEMDDLVANQAMEGAAQSYRRLLRDNRSRDRAAGRTLIGPHASELKVVHLAKGMPAAQGSTGEQKAMLIALVLAHARLVLRVSGLAPLILLDEIAAHLDHKRRHALYHELDDLGAQVWMTGTDVHLFDDLAVGSDRFMIADGSARRL